jgi:sarcosine oxidase, subunit beta
MGVIAVPEPGRFPARADIVVIGAGIVGAATAFFATRAGLSPIVVEKREEPGMLATAVSSECVREQWTQPHNIDMMRESLDMIEHFADLVKLPGYDIGLHQQGYLFVTAETQRARRFEKLVDFQHRHGLAGVELFDGAEVRRRFPWLAPDVLAGRYNRRDGWLAVHEMLWGFIKGSGADYYLQTRVTAIETDSRGVCAIVTDRGRIATRRAVIAAGPFAGKVARLAGINLPLLNIRRQEVRLARHGVCPPDAPMVVDDDNHGYWRPDGPAALLGGGEKAEQPQEPLEHVAADWEFPAFALENAMRLSPFWAGVAETLKAEEVFVNSGQYSYVADRCPVIGQTPVPGLYLNAAYDGHGVMGAPAGSRLLVDLVTRRVPAHDNCFPLDRLASGRHLSVEEAIL